MQETGSSLSQLDRVMAFLRDCGAEEFPHAREQSLYAHLLGTRDVLARWSQPFSLQTAGLLHSIYSTDTYHRQLVAFSQRSQVQQIAGACAERIAFLFCVTSRADLWDQLARNEVVGEAGLTIKRHAGDCETSEDLTREEIRSLIVLHMANTAEQAARSSGAPARWLARVSRLGLRLREFEGPLPPVFLHCSELLSDTDEEIVRDAYRKGLQLLPQDPSQAASYFAASVAACPYIAEPMIWEACVFQHRGDTANALQRTRWARQILSQWGVPWDKRLELEEWARFLDYLDQAGQSLLSLDISTTDELFHAIKMLGVNSEAAPAFGALCD